MEATREAHRGRHPVLGDVRHWICLTCHEPQSYKVCRGKEIQREERGPGDVPGLGESPGLDADGFPPACPGTVGNGCSGMCPGTAAECHGTCPRMTGRCDIEKTRPGES